LEKLSIWFLTWLFWGSGFLAACEELKLMLVIWNEGDRVLYFLNWFFFSIFLQFHPLFKPIDLIEIKSGHLKFKSSQLNSN
jgi:hypothetical protein